MEFCVTPLLKSIVLLLLCILMGCSSEHKEQAEDQNKIQPVFEKLESNQTNVTFSNTITENVSTKENIFDFDYFYNGAGVGIADINNDGLKDVFFCGNQVPNRLYLNKGDLTFEDITERSLINAKKGWSNGVTFVDINNDNWLDIYISQGGPYSGGARENLLYINQHNLTFVESGETYGLNDPSISMQTVFFDYDKDNDMDCVVMNENPLYGFDPVSFNEKLANDETLLHESSSHFYENIDGRYEDVTREVGLLKPTFGLGLVVSDINDDQWLDVYMTNDYYIPDLIFINQKDKTFRDQSKVLTSQLSFFGMGADIADINNDHFKDIFVLDMASADHYRAKTLMASMDTQGFDLLVNQLGYQYQYMFNSLQLNTGNNTFKNIAQLAGLAKTDWSWAVLMTDFNNDPKKDIFITNGYRRYALNNDTRMNIIQARRAYQNVPEAVKKQIYYSMPTEKLPNLMFQNDGDLSFTDQTKSWGLSDPSYSNGAAYADLDNDGDLELVVNNIDEQAFIYKNMSVETGLGNFLNIETTGELSESFPKVIISHNGTTQIFENKRVRGYLSSVDLTAHFGLGDVAMVDTVRVEWPSGKWEERYDVRANNVIYFNEREALSGVIQNETLPLAALSSVDPMTQGLSFSHDENDYDDFVKEVLLPYKQSTLGPYIASADVNGDRRKDIYIGGASGQAGRLFLAKEVGFEEQRLDDFEKDRHFEDMESVFFDYDGDKDLDLYVVSGGNEQEGKNMYTDRLYLNDGNGRFSKATNILFNGFAEVGKTVCSLDYDNDGDADLVVGNRITAQHYPVAAPSYIFENRENTFVNVTDEVLPELNSFGVINKVIASDFDNDGWMDLVIAGEWTAIGLFKNVNGKFRNLAKENDLLLKKGWWFSIQETDVNDDGLPDFVIGNVGLNTKYKASMDKPLKVFASDFDNNGTFDLVLSSKYKDKYVPLRGRECSSQQMPFIAKKYPTFDGFAKASLIDVYGDQLNRSYQKEATFFESVLLINGGNGHFKVKPLPVEAQFFPILDMETYDFNKDGYQDLLLVGGIYDTEVETPRFDAGTGLMMFSNQKDNYHPVPISKSGFYFRGASKSVSIVDDLVVVGINNAPLSTFKIN